jgi:methylenetetrahydrofolate--tRNA-(uracil-5-)-methyltransferase
VKSKPNIRVAGQITGCEGYVESAAIGLIAARFAAGELRGDPIPAPPVETALGALLAHITGGADAATYQPMNVNFGLMPPPDARVRKADRKKAYTDRARAALAAWLELLPQSSKPTPRDHSTPSDHSTSRRHSSEGWNPDRVRELH